MWAYIVSILELFDRNNCSMSCTVVGLQTCRHLQGEGNFFCKGRRVLAWVANCSVSGVSAHYRPTLRFPCPRTCLFSQLAH